MTRTRVLLAWLAAVLSIECGAASPPVTVAKPVVYQYAFVAPAGDHRAGEWLTLVWKATPTTQRADAPPHARLCVALAGPYDTVESLKRQASDARTCPVTGPGVVVATATLDADPVRPDDVTGDLVLPASLAPGFYNVINVIVMAPGNSMSGAGIIRIVAP